MKNTRKCMSAGAIAIMAALILITGCVSFSKPAPQGKWSFIVVGDSRGKDDGINAKVVKRLVQEIAKEQPKFVLFPGDLITGYSSREENIKMLLNWRSVVTDKLLESGIKVYPVRGNHELCKGDNPERLSALAWHEVFSGKYALPADGPRNEEGLTYSFRYRDVLFLNLDSYVEENNINQQWVDEQISGKKPLHIFAQTHEPLFSLEGAHQGCLQIEPERRDKLVNSLVKAGSLIFFCGHDHWYDHCVVQTNGVQFRQFTIGTGGAPLTTSAPGMKYKGVSNARNVAHSKCYGYAVVEIAGKSVKIKMKKLNDDGTTVVIDEFSSGACKPTILTIK